MASKGLKNIWTGQAHKTLSQYVSDKIAVKSGVNLASLHEAEDLAGILVPFLGTHEIAVNALHYTKALAQYGLFGRAALQVEKLGGRVRVFYPVLNEFRQM